MKPFLIAAFIALFATPVLACKSDSQCSIGKKCVKEDGQADGKCEREKDTDKDKDLKAYRDLNKSGKTCDMNPDCEVDEKCFKDGRRYGVCVPR